MIWRHVIYSLKYLFLFAAIVSLLIIVYKSDHAVEPMHSKSKEIKTFPRLGTILTECKDVDPPEGLDKNKYYDYCKCVKNPVDMRSKEEKREVCRTV